MPMPQKSSGRSTTCTFLHDPFIEQLLNADAVATTLEKSVYLITGWANWENGVGGEDPRTLEMQVRVYAPVGTLAAVDFKYDYHYRVRMFGDVESFSSLVAHVRKALDLCTPPRSHPTFAESSQQARGAAQPSGEIIPIFKMQRAYKGDETRRVAIPATMKNLINGKLFSFKPGTVSHIKCAKIALAIASVGYHREDHIQWVFQNFKLKNKDDWKVQGEETDDEVLVMTDNYSNKSRAKPKKTWRRVDEYDDSEDDVEECSVM
ncbi:hypothetical protein M427DRAFT_27454 [Gonapodya prolifera JEL478]|uniref:Uncharacterized protein n=1 Tax=Gonapodya prolifera (strain JEL478) TaxID=1344416 RepID=A0A139AYZ2_GONPJ|nr:hypothetical protein M427DRAFT_27454 [Gonapodya prolifera JEL478]|eukprot:KXS21920.1 hypothetical protein M427DRAFT_27454 [Gonapodya prolifera JEL478]